MLVSMTPVAPVGDIMDVDTVDSHPFASIAQIYADSVGRECIPCERTVLIEPAGMRVPVITAALWRLPYLRTHLTWGDRGEKVSVIFEEDTEAFCILLQALHREEATWDETIPEMTSECLNVLKIAKKYQHLDLVRHARRLVLENISRQSLTAVGSFLCRNDEDHTDTNLTECPAPRRSRTIATAIVSWIRTRRAERKYVELVDDEGHYLPTWCLLQLLTFSGDPLRRWAACRALWRRAKDYEKVESVSGWDLLLVRFCRSCNFYSTFEARIREALANHEVPIEALESNHTKLRRHNSDSNDAADRMANEWRNRRYSQTEACTISLFASHFAPSSVLRNHTHKLELECVLGITPRPLTNYGVIDATCFTFQVGDLTLEGSLYGHTDVQDGLRKYRYTLSLGLVSGSPPIRLKFEGHLMADLCFPAGTDKTQQLYHYHQNSFSVSATTGQSFVIAQETTSGTTMPKRMAVCVRVNISRLAV